MYRHLFVLDPFEKLNLKIDSSLQVAAELLSCGDSVSYCVIGAFEWESGSRAATAMCWRLDRNGDGFAMPVGEPKREFLDHFDLIHMRKDPPFDIEYVASTWFLDSCLPQTRVLNDPSALRGLNEKLVTLLFPNDIVPTLVSSDPDSLASFFEGQGNRDVIVKPFDQYGGHGIVRLDGSHLDSGQLKNQLLLLTEGGKKLRIVQPFQPDIFGGEVRCFTFGPEPIAWTLKRPAAGSFMANTRLGATLEGYKPSIEDVNRVKRVGGELSRRGVWMIGFDMIGGRITEVNVTSPRLLSTAESMRSDHGQLARFIRKWMDT